MSAPPSERPRRVIVTNRKAQHLYHIVHRIEAGIALQGTEVKSLRQGKVNLTDAYATFLDKSKLELWLVNLHIAPYEQGSFHNHNPTRPRKLLLHRRELVRLRTMLEEKGMTIVPLALYFSGPYVKVELGVVRGKKLYDRREDIKQRDLERELRRSEE
ncbi:MAG: SsrA-binding protein SmpB [Bacteroidota bacterium]|nr:SsrA-binding protein SmpB [Candidatus Kapabacteria bacterium]MCS7302890.1 SsrA-binding protein SmpB [Candidatus Kapabacteria bacterium]MCX7936654.1 SsrA-binding protein SmpB [Chlorobiota bacterium]MDW8075384.1 SsrA-binding protein SmpB [Bacteroidota bacterium]MDW8272169.1 SsrA-binding protein SmpB [Bacteroidota bacterium]